MTTNLPKSMGAVGLFTGAPQFENFANMRHIMPHNDMVPTQPRPWEQGEPAALPASFEFGGEQVDTDQFLAETDTVAVLVVKDGKIRFEQYFHTGAVDQPWLSASVAKSFTSTLVGIAFEEGLIRSLSDPISDYVPVEAGSAYDGVSIESVLHMSSGARWDEDYSNPDSDIANLLRATDEKGDGLDGFVARMVKEAEPETICRYNSGETQILGALVAQVSGKSLTEYMQEKLVEPLGFEHDSYWITDLNGVELSYGGLNCTARDYARLGQLFLDGGKVGDKQVISSDWIKAALHANSPIREVGKPLISGQAMPLGYGYQWWLDSDHDGVESRCFSAFGIYNQSVYVNPDTRTIVVRLSALRSYGTSPLESDNRDLTTIAFLRAVSKSI